MSYKVSVVRRGARRFHFKTAAEAVSKAIELVQAGIPTMTITDLTRGRVYRPDELWLLQSEAGCVLSAASTDLMVTTARRQDEHAVKLPVHINRPSGGKM